MAINYEKVGWDTTKFVGPTNMNHMDTGIKKACDGVDALNTAMGDADISKVGDGTAKGAILELNNNLSEAILQNTKKIRYTAVSGSTDGNGIVYIGSQHSDGATPVLVIIGDNSQWFECTILSTINNSVMQYAARIRTADGKNYAGIQGVTLGVIWAVPTGII